MYEGAMQKQGRAKALSCTGNYLISCLYFELISAPLVFKILFAIQWKRL
jgi:hypothetical protein